MRATEGDVGDDIYGVSFTRLERAAIRFFNIRHGSTFEPVVFEIDQARLIQNPQD